MKGAPASRARRRAISVLPTPVGPDHEDVLGRDLGRRLLVDLLAAPAVAQRDGHGALGVLLADDVAVELGDDLLGGHGRHGGLRGKKRFLNEIRPLARAYCADSYQ
jgi:hypothetical protein